MKYAALLVFALLSATLLRAQEIKPYDRLGKENVRITGKQVSGGANKNGGYSVNSSRGIEIEITRLAGKSEPLNVHFFFVFKDQSNGKDVLSPCEVQVLPIGVGRLQYTADAARYNLQPGAKQYETGQTFGGWCVQAIRDGRIVGVGGSSGKYEDLAAKPIQPNP